MLSYAKKLKAITDAFERYPLTVVFLVASAVLISMQIKTDNDYFKYQLACLVGAALSIALQAAYERYFVKLTARLTLMGAGVVLTLVYYLFINSAPELSAEIGIKTSVVLFALLIAYMYVPVIKNTVSFNESFMATFKAFFQAAFFAGVLFAGCAIILGAIDTLIYDLDSKIYAHTANIVFVIFAPIFFLSLIPLYPGRVEQQTGKGAAETQHEAVDKAAQSPKFLEILISYIIIPLAVIFTGILAVYIAINIGGEFWTDNLLEPMLVSYAVGIILLTILSSPYGKQDDPLVPINLPQGAHTYRCLPDRRVDFKYRRYGSYPYALLRNSVRLVCRCVRCMVEFDVRTQNWHHRCHAHYIRAWLRHPAR